MLYQNCFEVKLVKKNFFGDIVTIQFVDKIKTTENSKLNLQVQRLSSDSQSSSIKVIDESTFE